MTSNPEASRQELLSSLKGRSLYIPNLQALLDHWPQYVNPQVHDLQKDVDERLQTYGEHFRFNIKRLSVNSIIMKVVSSR